MNKLLVLALGLSVIVSGAVLADVESTAQDVAQELPSPRVVDCVLKDRDNGRLLETVDEQLSVLTYPCSGGLYLLDSSKDSPEGLFSGNLTPLVQGWFFHDGQITERISHDRLRVTARFVTGVGPKGARAFYASIPVTRVDGVWQAGEPTHGKASERPRDFSTDVFPSRATVVTSQKELDRIVFCRGQRAVDFDIDFAAERLLLVSAYLKSSKIQITNPLALQGPERVWLRFTRRVPGIVTKDLKTTIVWYILPKDDRPLGSGQPESFALLTPVDGARTGVIDRCSLKFVE